MKKHTVFSQKQSFFHVFGKLKIHFHILYLLLLFFFCKRFAQCANYSLFAKIDLKPFCTTHENLHQHSSFNRFEMVSRFLIHNFALSKVLQIVLYQQSLQVAFLNFWIGTYPPRYEFLHFKEIPMHALSIKKRVFTTAKLILIPRTTPLTELVTHHANFTVKRRDNA